MPYQPNSDEELEAAEISILKFNVRQLTEQLADAYKRIAELTEEARIRNLN